MHLPFSRRSDPFILIAPLASGNGTWSERFLFHVLDPKDKYFSRNVIDLCVCGAVNDDQANKHQGLLVEYFSRNVIDLCGAVNDDQANRHQDWLVDDFSEESRSVRYKKGYKL